jgi:hypothetical protein
VVSPCGVAVDNGPNMCIHAKDLLDHHDRSSSSIGVDFVGIERVSV